MKKMTKKIRTGDIILSRFVPGRDMSKGVLAPLVRWCTGSEYVHAMVVVNDFNAHGNDSYIISEALYEGVVNRIVSEVKLLENIMNDDYHVFRPKYDFTSEEITNLRLTLFRMSGRRYSIKDLFKILLYKWFGISNFQDTYKQVTCAEVIVRAYYESIGVSLVPNVVPDLVTPGDLAKSEFLYEVNV